jgi:flagellar biosynthetic protein FlhB
MAHEADVSERTEAATPRRMQEAREGGNVALSREATSLAGLIGLVLALALIVPVAARRLVATLGGFLSAPTLADAVVQPAAALDRAIAAWAGAAGAVMAVVALAGIAATMAQTGPLLHLGALGIDLGRISPLAGLRRLASLDTVFDAARSLAKLALAAGLFWLLGRHDGPRLAAALGWDSATLADAIARDLLRIIIAVLTMQATMAAIDLLRVRLRHARSLRMSRQEVRDELKETDGDPHTKTRLRQLRAQRARRRMLAAVPTATVVVTNPTHYAVALLYDRARHDAPRVVAKGVDELAARIRAVAEANHVPLVANPPLARALHAIPLDAFIPPELYQAVAEIIAYVWRLDRRAHAARQSDPRRTTPSHRMATPR